MVRDARRAARGEHGAPQPRWPCPLPDDAMTTARPPLQSDAAARRGQFDTTLRLRHAGDRRLTLRYELRGRAGMPLVLVAGGISAHRHLGASAEFPDAG